MVSGGGKRQQLHLRSVFGSHKHSSSKKSIPPTPAEPKKGGKRGNRKDAPAVSAAVSKDCTETAAEGSDCSVLSGVDYYPDDYSVSSSYHSQGTSVGPTTSRTNNFCGEVHKHISSKECVPSAFVVPKPEGKQEKQKGALFVSAAAVSKDCTEKTVGCSDCSVLSSFDYYPDDYSICSSYHSQGTNVVPTTTGTNDGDFTRVFKDSCNLGPKSDISDDDDDDYSYDWSYSVGFRDTDVPS